MNILFIGGTGNISTDCAALLYERGHGITVLSRGRSAVPPQYRTVIADRKDPAAMRGALRCERADVVLDSIGYELGDVQEDYQLFKDRIQQYIFISSATVYAKPPSQLPICDDAPLGNTFWEYAQKELICEQWLLQRWRGESFAVTIVRPSHTYSKRWIPNPLSSSSYTFAARLEEDKPVYIPDNGQSPWTLTASSDFALGLAGLVGSTQSLGEAVHISDNQR